MLRSSMEYKIKSKGNDGDIVTPECGNRRRGAMCIVEQHLEPRNLSGYFSHKSVLSLEEMKLEPRKTQYPDVN